MKSFNTAGNALAAAAQIAANMATRKASTQAARPAAAPAAALVAPGPSILEALQMPEEAPTPTLAPVAPAVPAPAPRAARLPRGKMPTIATAGRKVQFNVLLGAEPREKLRRVAFAWGTSERELIEKFIAELPDIAMPEVAAPPGMKWLTKPR